MCYYRAMQAVRESRQIQELADSLEEEVAEVLLKTPTPEGPVELPRNTVTQTVQISWNWGIYTLSSGSGEVVVSGPVEAAQTLLNR